MKSLRKFSFFAVMLAMFCAGEIFAANNVPEEIFYYIALTDRSLEIPLVGWVADHTILEYWEAARDLKVGKEYSFLRKNPKIKIRKTVELLGETYKEKFACLTHKNCSFTFNVTISVINYDNTSAPADDDYAIIAKSDLKSEIESNWSHYLNNAKAYDFAEQQGFNGFFLKWNAVYRNSEYQALGNNCHTFTRHLCGNLWINMWGSHPGNKIPKKIIQSLYTTINEYDQNGNITRKHECSRSITPYK